MEQPLEATEEACAATGIADGNLDAYLAAHIVGFAVRNLLADGARNLLDHFLAFITAGGDQLLFHYFASNLLGNLHRANFFAWLPGLHAVGAARDSFLNIGVFREQATQLGTEVEPTLVSTRIVAAVAAAVATTVAAVIARAAAAVNANLLANRVARILTLFGNPFATANLDLLLFPNGIAYDPLAFDFFGLVDRLADDLTNFLHDCLGDSLVAGACPLFGHGLPFGFVTYPGGMTAGVCSRGTSHDGRSATATTAISLRCCLGTEDSQNSCNGRG